jgi:broad specificity phosphatase PhoE
MPPRVVLVRHGRSAHVHRGGWVDAEGLRRWRAAYEAAAIAGGDAPPAALLAEAARAGVVAASDAPRAVASAERLAGGGRAVVVSPLLRETGLRVPGWVGWRMPLSAWALAIGVEWLRGTAAGGRTPPESLARAAAAADWLAALARERGDVVAVTHGDFRRLLVARLRRLGWTPVGGGRGVRNWSAWRFAAPGGAGPDDRATG